MASSNLEDLLQEALADFEEPQQGATSAIEQQQDKSGTSPATATSAQAFLDAQPTNKPPASTVGLKPAPKGLGLGLGGSDLLGRRLKKTVGGTADSAAHPSLPQNAEQGDDVGDEEGASGVAKPTRKLPAEAQRLADDLMSLLQEAGLGEKSEPQDADSLTACLADLMASAGAAAGSSGSGGGGPLRSLGSDATAHPGLVSGPAPPGAELGEDDPFAQLFGRILGGLVPPDGGAPGGGDDGAPPPPPPEFAAMLQQMMGMQGLAAGTEARPAGPAVGHGGAPGAGPPSNSAMAADDDDDDALASSRLAGLAHQTRRTVSQQAKKTRGHVEGGAGTRAAGGGTGGLPFGIGSGGGAGGGGLASMLRELGGLGLPGGGGGDGEGAAPAGVGVMVDYIMQHLLSKDVLYGPLKEIRDRYPPWLEAHQGMLPAEDYRRYVAQYESVQRVCAHYETSPSDFAKLMDLIQEMQTYGDPPGDIVEEMTGGAGRDINAILAGAEAGGEAAEQHPALEELSSELDKCKVQ